MERSIRSSFGVEMMKIPKKIRTMSMQEFSAKFGGNLKAASKKHAGSAIPQTLVRPSKAGRPPVPSAKVRARMLAVPR